MRINITHFDSVGSTNDIAASMAREGAPEGSVIVADEQTAGRGRFNRSWISSGGKGLWMSLVLKPPVQAEKVAQLTMVAAMAVADAVKVLYDAELQMKWPNDLLLNGRKVCGILCESALKGDKIEYVIAGIGINFRSAEIHGPMQLSAAYLEEVTSGQVDRDVLLKQILKEFGNYYKRWISEPDLLLNAARKRIITLGKEVEVSTPEGVFRGRAVDIDLNGSLLVRNHNGETRTFNAGDVSLHKL